MPRPKALVPKSEVHVSMSQQVFAKLQLYLYDPTSDLGRVPLRKGALSEFIELAVVKELAARGIQ